MEICKPDPEKFLLPEGTREVNIAENQSEYLTLPALVTPDGRVACQWKPEPNDLLLLNMGVPLTIVLHTFNQPLQPLQVAVGGVDLRLHTAPELEKNTHTCPRRDDLAAFGMPRQGNEGEDRWRGPDHNGVRTCSYCGSLHPDDFMRLAKDRVRLGPTDKNYKVYVDIPETQGDELRVISASCEDNKPSWGTQKWEVADLEILRRDGWGGSNYKWMLRAPRGVTAFGKFYFQHLSLEQRIEFVDLINQKTLNIGDPGFFYRMPFFCVKA